MMQGRFQCSNPRGFWYATVSTLVSKCKTIPRPQKCARYYTSSYPVGVKQRPRLVFLGAPGVGKGTYARLLGQSWKLAHVSTGDLFRQEIAGNTPLGVQVKETCGKGELVPDKLALEICKKRLLEAHCSSGWILDGFPRTLNQAAMLSTFAPPSLCVNLHLRRDILIKKLLARRICAECGLGFNLAGYFDGHYDLPPLPPPKDCEKCRGSPPLLKRSDDTLLAIRRRLELYDNQSAPLCRFYEEENKLLRFEMKRVSDGAHIPEKSRYHESVKQRSVMRSIENEEDVHTMSVHDVKTDVPPSDDSAPKSRFIQVTQEAYDEYKRGVEALNRVLKPENLKTIKKLTEYLTREQNVADSNRNEEQALASFQEKLASLAAPAAATSTASQTYGRLGRALTNWAAQLPPYILNNALVNNRLPGASQSDPPVSGSFPNQAAFYQPSFRGVPSDPSTQQLSPESPAQLPPPLNREQLVPQQLIPYFHIAPLSPSQHVEQVSNVPPPSEEFTFPALLSQPGRRNAAEFIFDLKEAVPTSQTPLPRVQSVLHRSGSSLLSDPGLP